MPLARKKMNRRTERERQMVVCRKKKARASTKRKTRQGKIVMLKKIFTKINFYCGKPKEIFKERCIKERNCSGCEENIYYFPAIGWLTM